MIILKRLLKMQKIVNADLLDEALSRLRTDEFDKLLEYIEDELEDYKE